LVKILGKEMLSYVYDTCNEAFPNKVFVLTDDKRISNFCKKKKFRFI
jgi:CMP-2-keto-3-deoxyoctulosonic acid synthetase